MSPKKANGGKVLRWVWALVLLSGAIWFWSNHQWAIDAARVAIYKPSTQIETISSRAKLADQGQFYFYASQPEVQTSKPFNESCERKEDNGPILGCYSARQIFIYDVTDERLDGIKEVTAAHEMLHAAFDRLGQSEKDRLGVLLANVYRKVNTPELVERMAYYARTEPGESVNELHSILGTEFNNLGSELEDYYRQYFSDRIAVVALNEKVQTVRGRPSLNAAVLVSRVNTLAALINRTTAQYNLDSKQLNQSIKTFNERANRSGGFTTQAEFAVARDELSARSDRLASDRQQIEANIITYQNLIAQIDSVTAESASLNRSLDSTLTTAPTL